MSPPFMQSLYTAFLGDQFIDLKASLDLDTVKVKAKYNIGPSYVSGVSNLPSEISQVSGAALTIEVIPFGNYIIQRVCIINNGATFQRTCMNNNWKSWGRNDNYGTSNISDLAAALGVIPSGYNKRLSADLNENITPVFTYSSGWTNYPSDSYSSGFLEVAVGYTRNSNTLVLQRYTRYDGSACHQRTMYNSVWSEWHQIY